MKHRGLPSGLRLRARLLVYKFVSSNPARDSLRFLSLEIFPSGGVSGNSKCHNTSATELGITPDSPGASLVRKSKCNPEGVGGATTSLYTHANTDTLGLPIGSRGTMSNP